MPALGLPPVDPAFEMTIASRGMSQGLPQTDGAQVFPRISVRAGAVQVGAQWRNIDSLEADGVAAIFVRYVREVGKVELEARIADRLRTGVKGSAARQAWEYGLGARAKIGKIGVRTFAEYSSDEFGHGSSLYAETGASYDVGKSTRLLANIGRRERAGAPDYFSISAGISRTVTEGLSVDLRLYGTDRGGLGAAYRPRLVFSGRIVI